MAAQASVSGVLRLTSTHLIHHDRFHADLSAALRGWSYRSSGFE